MKLPDTPPKTMEELVIRGKKTLINYLGFTAIIGGAVMALTLIFGIHPKFGFISMVTVMAPVLVGFMVFAAKLLKRAEIILEGENEPAAA